MGASRSTVTAVTVLAVAAVTAVGASAVLVSQPNPAEPVVGFSAPASQTPGAAQPRAKPPTSDLGRARRDSAAPAPPRRLRVPAIGTDAMALPTGVTARGDAEIPRSGDEVGWYRFGAVPGDAQGSAVLIGHRDTDVGGPGELFELDE